MTDVFGLIQIGKGQDVPDTIKDICFEPHSRRIADTIVGELHEHHVGLGGKIGVRLPARWVATVGGGRRADT